MLLLPVGSGRRRGSKSGSEKGGASTKGAAACSFTFRELATATRNFKEVNLIGEGGFGKVYKGRLETGEASDFFFFWGGEDTVQICPYGLVIDISIDRYEQVVAIKQLNHDGLQGFQEFIVEVLMLSLLHHPNLVTLIGYCTDGDQRLLVYEYMPRGSLEDHLFGNVSTCHNFPVLI